MSTLCIPTTTTVAVLAPSSSVVRVRRVGSGSSASSTRVVGGAVPRSSIRSLLLSSGDRQTRRRLSLGRRAGVRASAAGGDDDNDDLFAFLNEQMEKEEEGGEGGGIVTDAGVGADDVPEPGSPMSGEELRQLVYKKWGKMYDTRIHQRRDQFNKLGLYLQVMWKYVGQKSFPMTEAQYMEQLDAVAGLLTEWGAQDEVRASIPASTKFPKMDTTGANAVMIPLNVEVED